MDTSSRGALHLDSPHLVRRAAPVGFSRGELVRRGAVATAGVAAFGLLDATGAFGASGADPKPIPGGFALPDFSEVPSNPFIHVLSPEIGHEMSTITDFNGVVAASHVQGQARGSDGSTYSFDTDMRFMQGLYVGTDGRLRRGSFGFIWIDLFTGSVPDPSTQVHDFNPGIAASGLFWTAAMPASTFDAKPGAGRGRFHAESLAMPDYHDLFNAVTGGPSQPGHVTFDIGWQGGGERRNIRDTTFDFAGEFVAGDSTVSFTVWDDQASNVRYSSLSAGQTTVSAALGHERNGVFFQQGGD